MDFSTLYTEVAAIRFNSQTAQVTRIKKAMNAAEVGVWGAAPWVFKFPTIASLTLAAGDNTPTMPADFGKERGLYSDVGDKLRYFDPDRFDDLFQADIIAGSRGVPDAFTVRNREIELAPIPDAVRTFKLAYRRRLCHLNTGGSVVAGPMSADTDTPIWPSEHHYILVPWTIILLGKLEGGGDLDGMVSERDTLLAAMRSDLIGGVEGEVEIWGV